VHHFSQLSGIVYATIFMVDIHVASNLCQLSHQLNGLGQHIITEH